MSSRSPTSNEKSNSTNDRDDTILEMLNISEVASPENSDDDYEELEDLEIKKVVPWWPYFLKHLAIMIIGGLLMAIPVIVTVYVEDLNFLSVILKDDTLEKNDKFKKYYTVIRVFSWATGMVVITTLISLLVSLIPRAVLYMIRFVDAGKTELVKQYLEFYLALTTTIKVVLSTNIAFGLWCINFNKAFENFHNMSDVEPETVMFRVILCIYLGTLLISVEKIIIQFIAVRFHRTAYRQRLDEAAYATYDRLNKARRLASSQGGGKKSTGPASGYQSTPDSSFSVKNIVKMPKEISHTPSGTQYSFPKPSRQSVSLQPNKEIYHNINKSVFEGRYEDDVDLHSKAEARKLAAKIFSSLQNRKRNLLVEDIIPFFPTREDAQKAFDLFDKDGNGDISKREMRDQISHIYKERKDITIALRDTSQAVGKLDIIFIIIFLVIIALVCALVFGKDLYGTLIPFGTFFVALSFIFGDMAKQLFESIIFLFVMHPYDTGDRVYIDTDNFVVQKVGLLGSKFCHTNGQIAYIPHTILIKKIIYNIRRSSNQAESIEFQIDFDTPKEKIIAMKERLNRYLIDEEPREFYADPLLALTEIVDSNKLKFFIWLEHKANWQDGGRRWARKTRFMIALREIFRDLGMRYSLLVQRVEHLNPPPYSSNNYPAGVTTPQRSPTRPHSPSFQGTL